MSQNPDVPGPAQQAPRKQGTFRRRLTYQMASYCLAALLIVCTLVYVSARRMLAAGLDAALLSIARTEIASEIDAPDKKIHVHAEPPTPLGLASDLGYEKFATIQDQRGRVLAATDNLADGPPMKTDPEAVAMSLNGKIVFGDIPHNGAALRGVYYPTQDPYGNKLLTIVALSKAPMQRYLVSLLQILALCLVGGSGLAALGVWQLAPRLTSPLEQIAETARRISQGDLARRMPQSVPVQELATLTSALNAMLERLETMLREKEYTVESQRRFITDASHELRSPIFNLSGTVEVALRRERSADEYRQTLQTALGEIQRITRLVEALLTLSRLDAGQLALDCAPCNLVDVTQQAVRAMQAAANEKGVRITLLAPRVCSVFADADRLRQVLDNLLHNAARSSPQNSEITVRLTCQLGACALEIIDRGPGIPPEDIDRIFDRFYRSDASRSRDSGGLGLGLSISRAIVEAHGGRLTAHSRIGEGATFLLRLPAADSSASGSTTADPI